MTPKDYVEAIRAHGLTQQEIAGRTGIAQSTISKIERGQVLDVLSRHYLSLRVLHDELKRHKKRAKKSQLTAA